VRIDRELYARKKVQKIQQVGVDWQELCAAKKKILFNQARFDRELCAAKKKVLLPTACRRGLTGSYVLPGKRYITYSMRARFELFAAREKVYKIQQAGASWQELCAAKNKVHLPAACGWFD
jgi:hypothetical protein